MKRREQENLYKLEEEVSKSLAKVNASCSLSRKGGISHSKIDRSYQTTNNSALFNLNFSREQRDFLGSNLTL